MILKKKVQVGLLDSGSGQYGSYIIRIASRENMLPITAFASVITHIKKLITEKYGDPLINNRAQRMLNDCDKFGQLPIVYSKTTEHEVETDTKHTIYYNQIVVDIPEEQAINGVSGQTSSSTNEIVGILQSMSTNYNEGWCLINQQLDFMYSIGIVRPNVYRGFIGIINNDPLFTTFRNKYYNSCNNLAFIYNIENENNIRSRNSVLKCALLITDNLQKAFELRNKQTYQLSCHDGELGTFIFQNLRTTVNGTMYFYTFVSNKIHIDWINQIPVLYDGYKGYETAKNYIYRLNRCNIKQINILQYGDLGHFVCQQIPGGLPSLTLQYINKTLLTTRPNSVSITESGFRGRVDYKDYRTNRIIRSEVNLSYSYNDPIMNNMAGYLILPIVDNQPNMEALEEVTKIINALHDRNNVLFREHCANYYNMLKNEITANQEDLLTKWFQYCTRTSKHTDDNIIQAYKNMKSKLEKEYKEIQNYLDYYDFSKCIPVPTINIDKKMLKNYYKTLHIEPQNYIIKSINNKKIQQDIVGRKSTITIQTIIKKNDVYMATYPLLDFYNRQNNSLELNYDDMKGAVIRDKVKNRR